MYFFYVSWTYFLIIPFASIRKMLLCYIYIYIYSWFFCVYHFHYWSGEESSLYYPFCQASDPWPLAFNNTVQVYYLILKQLKLPFILYRWFIWILCLNIINQLFIFGNYSLQSLRLEVMQTAWKMSNLKGKTAPILNKSLYMERETFQLNSSFCTSNAALFGCAFNGRKSGPA